MGKLIRESIAAAFIVTFFYALFMPLPMTKYTLSDGEHTIVFQSMIHIARPDFYKSVETDAKSYADNGYTFLYEGIRAGKVDNSHNEADIPSYDISSYMLGLTSQSSNQYFSFVRSIPNSADADVDVDWILAQYATHGIVVKKQTPMSKEELTNLINNIKKHHRLYAAIGVPLSRVAARVGHLKVEFAELTDSYSPADQVILVNRNKVLYDAIVNSHADKIYINYGAAHFPNFYYLLKSHNSNWHIVDEDSFGAF